jgi:hypothetical protein
MMEKRQHLQQMLLENWISTYRRLKLEPCCSSCTNINSKWVKELNIRLKILKQLQEVVGNTLEHISIGNDFLNRTSIAKQSKERINKWDCIKLKCSAQQKKRSLDLRDCPQNGRKSLPAIHPIRD